MAKKINVSHLLDEFDENISQTNDKKAAQKKKRKLFNKEESED